MKIINNMLSYLNLLCTLFLTRRMQDIFLCLSKVNIRVASWSEREGNSQSVKIRNTKWLWPVLLCSLYHLLVTTATALELLLPQLGLAVATVSPELKLAGEDMLVVVVGSHWDHMSASWVLISISRRSGFCWILAKTGSVNYSWESDHSVQFMNC